MGDSSGEIDAEVLKDYDIKKRIGKGAYGIVWRAVDRRNQITVAVKKIYDAFRNKTDAQRTYREVIFLREFSFHPNIVNLLRVMKADNHLDLYLVLECMDTDLHNVIKEGDILKDVHKRYIMFQLLSALKCLHSKHVIHRDLKPSNILLDVDCRIRVADFGLARPLFQSEEEEEGDPSLTEYVATRWYRAPEILLAGKAYTAGVDMWSVGCILAEMLMEKPVFPGSSTLNQIELIMSAIPQPTFQDIQSICSGYARAVLDRASNRPKRPLRKLIPDAPDDSLDLLVRLLVFNPRKRLSAEEALSHPYVNRFNGKEDTIPVSSTAHSVGRVLRENIKLSVDGYRQKLYQIIDESSWSDPPEVVTVSDDNIVDKNDENSVDDPEELETERLPEDQLRQSFRSSMTPRGETEVSSSRATSLTSIDTAASISPPTVVDCWMATEEEPLKSGGSISNRGANSGLRKAASHECIQSTSPEGVMTSSVRASERNFFGLPPAGLPSHHPRANSASVWLRYHNPLIAREIVHHFGHRKQLVTNTKTLPKERPKPSYGRKQFANHGNVASHGASQNPMHTYAQSHGAIAASALQQLRLGK